MKINKKIALATAGLLTMSAFASLSLVSCSQGSNPNLNTDYNFTVNGNKYHVGNNGQIQIANTGADGKDTYADLPDLSQFHKAEDNGKPIPNSGALAAEKTVTEAQVGFLVSSYIKYTADQYLNLWTSTYFNDEKNPKIKTLADSEKNFY